MALTIFNSRESPLAPENPRARKTPRTQSFEPDISEASFIPPLPGDSPFRAEPIAATIPRRQRSIKERAGPSARIRLRREFVQRRKELKKELAQCERDCKSLCNKKSNRKSRKNSKKKTKKVKKHAKKSKRR